ncbi:hypothetical protein TNIN_81271 [Trichonephila inaurata madagascariensis]|uniref:Uncharacterized protein n=1 Tax=Trichonephila inaurata madagascariensis TaxID=2747483 RepID=A0A8X7CJP4_9ARAC|nr:hypothetical protein TNIN_81271 [Trichonephila inaurata madagascariensis]
MLDGLRATDTSFRPSWGPQFRGERYRESIVYPLSARQMFAFQHFSSPFGAFNRNTKASDAVEDVRGTFRHTLNPFTEKKKGCKPCQRACEDSNA